jgi:hypothetical protein
VRTTATTAFHPTAWRVPWVWRRKGRRAAALGGNSCSKGARGKKRNNAAGSNFIHLKRHTLEGAALHLRSPCAQAWPGPSRPRGQCCRDSETSAASHFTRCTSHVTRQTLHVTRHTSHVTRHTAHNKRHTSHGTRHTSHVTLLTGCGGLLGFRQRLHLAPLHPHRHFQTHK